MGRKSLLFWVEVVCETCSVAGPGTWTHGYIPAKRMKADALAAGWTFYQGMSFCSERCRKIALTPIGG